MLTSLRSRIGNFYLHKETAKSERARTLKNLSDSHRIGILYILNDTSDYDRISKFVSDLQQDRKEVKALGLVKSRSMITRFLPKLSYDFFSMNDVNWFFKPGGDKIHDFINTDFDLLIDLSLSESLPLKYISGLSKSHCRVGRFDERNKHYYDFMINMNVNSSLDEFIAQVTHYLTIINKSNVSK